jgi:Kef-type K+ transport system membrane component KefB
VLGTSLLAWVIVMVLVFGAAIMLGLVFGMFGLPDRITEMLGGILMVPLFPLIGVTMSLLYYDLRVRSEGADVQAMVNALPETT